MEGKNLQDLKEKREEEYKKWYRVVSLYTGQRAFVDLRQIVEIGETVISKKVKLYRYDIKFKDGQSVRVTKRSFIGITSELYKLSQKGDCKLG